MSAQSKPISEVIKEFEQSLESLRPSTRRVYVAAAKTAIRSAHLELWQCPSTLRLANYWPRSANRPAKEGTHLSFLKFFRERRARRIGVRRGFSCFAELGDSKTRKGGAFRENSPSVPRRPISRLSRRKRPCLFFKERIQFRYRPNFFLRIEPSSSSLRAGMSKISVRLYVPLLG